MDEATAPDPDFPCSLLISIPFPTHRLAFSALRTLQVDVELSPSVQRSYSLTRSQLFSDGDKIHLAGASRPAQEAATARKSIVNDGEDTVLRTVYKATTNRMLRVAVNGFMESLTVVLRIMEQLDVDVLDGA